MPARHLEFVHEFRAHVAQKYPFAGQMMTGEIEAPTAEIAGKANSTTLMQKQSTEYTLNLGIDETDSDGPDSEEEALQRALEKLGTPGHEGNTPRLLTIADSP